MGESLPGILHMHGNSNVIAGQEISLLNVMKVLRNDARQYVLLPEEGRFTALLREEGFEPILFPLSPFNRRDPAPYLRNVWDLGRLIRRNRINLVHSSGAYPNQHGAPAARLAAAKAICSLHTTVYRPPELRRSLLSLAHRVLVISEAVRDCARAAVPEHKILMRYYGVDLTRFDHPPPKAQIRMELGIPEGAIVIGNFSQLIARKRIKDFVRAAAKLKDRHPGLFALIVGEDHHGTGYRKELEDLIGSLGLADRTLMTGFRRDVDRIYWALDIFIFPSEAEGLGLVLLDAMAASKPVVASRIPGTIEAVVDGETGILYPLEDVDRLAEAIDRLAAAASERERMGRAGRARVESLFDGAICMEGVRQVFLALLPRK
jgi:glycosyltransferase involved in cell wall biosynthesis